MAIRGLKVVDTDAHYLEPIEQLADYADDVWKSRIKGVSPTRLLPMTLGDRMMEGRIRREDMDYNYHIGSNKEGEVKAAMNRLQIDASIFVPNHLISMGHTPVRDLVVALCNGYIDFMIDKVLDPDEGFTPWSSFHGRILKKAPKSLSVQLIIPVWSEYALCVPALTHLLEMFATIRFMTLPKDMTCLWYFIPLPD